jgi:hypothetical protein
MYSQRELIRLSAHKAVLQRRIAGHRAECVAAAARVTQPLEWLDRALSLWQRLSPLALLATVPLGMIMRRTSPRLKLLGSLFKWAPILFNAGRGFASMLGPRSRAVKS